MKQYLVIGAGRFGSSVAYHLFNKGNDVMIVDKSEDAISQVMNYATTVLVGNPSDEKLLNSIGVRNFDVVIIAFADDVASSLLLATLLKEVGAKKLISKAKNELQGRMLIKIGVDQVVYPERDMGKRVADSLSSLNILEHIELSDEYGILEIRAKNQWYGKSIGSIDFRKKLGLNVIAIKEDDKLDVTPNADTIINKGCTIIVIGRLESVKKL